MNLGWLPGAIRAVPLIAAGMVFLQGRVSGAPKVTLAWDASASSTVAGYRLYYGMSSRTYTDVLEVGNLTSGTVSNLAPANTYYFAVTAYDVAGLESDFSGEISYEVPTPSALLQIAVDPAQGAKLTGKGPAGYTYSVLVSHDLSNWAPVTNLTFDASEVFEWNDSEAPNDSQRFYRLQQLSP